ncbi:hypothetical protein C8R41DRAFT_818706 [Lentinula lateritia]|uniref:Uncharacterized protein n=1 Tax=Lentinula lateritia TaxID=40482 RepID=A0ABQ8VUS3_9AGAR|nr:hypothetical protein C8R41DRAFT_818706 [Lentinula lateritia]
MHSYAMYLTRRLSVSESVRNEFQYQQPHPLEDYLLGFLLPRLMGRHPPTPTHTSLKSHLILSRRV